MEVVMSVISNREWSDAGEAIAAYGKRLAYVKSRYKEVSDNFSICAAESVNEEIEELREMEADLESFLGKEASNV